MLPLQSVLKTIIQFKMEILNFYVKVGKAKWSLYQVAFMLCPKTMFQEKPIAYKGGGFSQQREIY